MNIPIWKQIQKQNITSLNKLSEFLELSEENKKKIYNRPSFILNVPLRLARKMKKNCLDDPIFRQFIPVQEEKIENKVSS